MKGENLRGISRTHYPRYEGPKATDRLITLVLGTVGHNQMAETHEDRLRKRVGTQACFREERLVGGGGEAWRKESWEEVKVSQPALPFVRRQRGTG